LDVFTFCLIVVVVGCATGIATTWIKGQQETRAKASPDELRELRRRIEALEQIVTDQSFELKREFERLEGKGR